MAETTTNCRHCRKLIAYALPLGYWYHRQGQSVYCDQSATTRAEP